MAIFVDLDEESEPPQAHGYYHHPHGLQPEWNNGGKESESSTVPSLEVLPHNGGSLTSDNDADPSQPHAAGTGTGTGADSLDLNKNAMTEALGCYP